MKNKINLILLSLFLFASLSFSQTKQLQSLKQESSIAYHLSHFFHEVDAASKEGNCTIDVDINKKEIKKVSVQVDVTSFDSGNSNRDSHAMEVIDALSYPDSRFISSSISQKGDSIKVYGKLTFHGITKDIVISALAKWTSDKLYINGKFDVSLTAFNVERPSLMLIKVNDILKFAVVQTFYIK